MTGTHSDVEKDQVRLPTNVTPIHYDISLEPDFTAFTYDGNVTIDLQVNADSSEISLNVLELKIRSAQIEKDGYLEEVESIK
jgi:aminopeptidase 2